MTAVKRAGMDYAASAEVTRHTEWSAFDASTSAEGRRIVLLSSGGATPLSDFTFYPNDIILMGSESSGVPAHIHENVGARVQIPMRAGFRSLNVAVAAGIALSEALRQTGQFAAGE